MTIDETFDTEFEQHSDNTPEEYKTVLNKFKESEPKLYNSMELFTNYLEDAHLEDDIIRASTLYEAVLDVFKYKMDKDVVQCYNHVYKAILSVKHEGMNQK